MHQKLYLAQWTVYFLCFNGCIAYCVMLYIACCITVCTVVCCYFMLNVEPIFQSSIKTPVMGQNDNKVDFI